MATITASVMEASPHHSTTNTPSSADDTNLWTPAQESALLQSIVRWKPVGMHKHFRMIAIRDHLLSSGAINPEDSHTSTAGIWRKLASLYDLEKLDEREDSIIFDGSGVGAASGVEDDSGGGGDESRRSVSSSRGAEYWREFELPRDEFEEMMWERRLALGESTESSPLTQPPSPDVVSAAAGTRRESTVADTDEPRSSPVSVSGRMSGRGGRGGRASTRAGGGGGGGRLSRLQNELETPKGERSASRRTSKAPSIVEQEQDEDKVMEDADDEDGEEEEHEESTPAEEDEDEEESEEHEEEEAEQKRSGPSKRGRGGGRRGRGRKRGRR
ncbi:uncharacterized protein Z520_03964 [Fonsecaea multimorphosa CBS 102226]|uniref:Chromatin modification-related protein EAF7 n=1 Tax=Fonsecaea multimorphosa CBS 102226 TaxID=1442371 RepID=A0A0D2KU48_9EURO|nr:uncharacterized protein Z520_03964 [Fonsecaea multimorphosa CBS 102226]KIY00279.1 hypothetical protein Z520_03964 [Fonsecaea multimorphosa CBS 102226]OAL27112.1 hypothetical protein AYO22_03743 [Fonsecaea multimorphosa]